MRKVLIVDDEATILKGLSIMVQRFSGELQVSTAENGFEALSLIREAVPDLLLTDVRMPKMDGLSLCQQLHENGWGVSTVVISGYSDFYYAQKCLSYGVKEYLLKPVLQEDLYPVLNRLLMETPASPSPISISRYQQWIHQTEATIWNYPNEAMEPLMADWAAITQGLPIGQLRLVIKDCLALLVDRLNEREVFRFQRGEGSLDVLTTVEEVQQYFQSKLEELNQELLLKRNGHQKNVFDEVMQYIDLHLAKEISLEEVAERVGLNPTYLSSLFKKTTQQSFVQYKTKKRIERAKQLLQQPHYRVTDVAAEVGYESYPHFVKLFKLWTGHTPSEYRLTLGMK